MAGELQDCPGCGLPGDDPIIETLNDRGERLCHHCGAEWTDPEAPPVPRRPGPSPRRSRWGRRR